MRSKMIAILAFSTLMLAQCAESMSDTKSQEMPVDPYISTQLLFSNVEYYVYTEDKTNAVMHIMQLYQNLSDHADVYCPDDGARVGSLADAVMRYAQQLTRHDVQSSLEKLRELKRQFLLINAHQDTDHYLYHLWQYEEDMYYTTNAAMDPMLNLYEWNEFVQMVACMNDDWELVKRHYPSAELLGNEQIQYKALTKSKINLEESMLRFNHAVDSDNYLKYDLCDHGAALRQTYVEYLKTLVLQYEAMMKPYLATI